MGGGLTWVSLGLRTVEPSGFSATYLSLRGWNILMINMDNRGRFFKPFKRLGASFGTEDQLPGGLLRRRYTLLTVAGNGA
jgi:hypothetical protein